MILLVGLEPHIAALEGRCSLLLNYKSKKTFELNKVHIFKMIYSDIIIKITYLIQK